MQGKNDWDPIPVSIYQLKDLWISRIRKSRVASFGIVFAAFWMAAIPVQCFRFRSDAKSDEQSYVKWR